MIEYLSCVLFLLCALSCNGANWYVSTNGTASGGGLIESPWNLATAVQDNTVVANSNHVVQAGDTIWLRGGTYFGRYDSELNGSVVGQVTVRNYNRERASIQVTNNSTTALYVNGDYSTFHGIEIWNSTTNRWESRNFGIYVNGANTKLINLIVHDVGNALYCYESSTNSEIYGGVWFNNGAEYEGMDRYHSIYIHSGWPGTSIKDNVVVNGFGYGVHAYSESGEPLNGITISGNVAMNAGILNTNPAYASLPNYLAGGTTPQTNLVFTENIGFQSAGNRNVELGYWNQTSDAWGNWNAFVSNNIVVGGWLRATCFTNFIFVSNVVANLGTTLMLNAPSTPGAYEWDRNRYYNDNGFTIPPTSYYSWDNWKSTTGFDANSTYSASEPTETVVIVRPNAYEAGRANITIINWAGDDNVSVDVSAVLYPGDTYELRGAQNYFGSAVLIGTYSGGSLTVPTTNLNVAIPIGFDSAPASTGPDFAAFVLLKTSDSTSPVHGSGNFNFSGNVQWQ